MLFTLKNGKKELTKITQTNNAKERAATAEQCTAVLKLSMPTLIDLDDNNVNRSYAAWPDRITIVGRDGRIAYQGGPGPWGFKVPEAETWLKENTKR